MKKIIPAGVLALALVGGGLWYASQPAQTAAPAVTAALPMAASAQTTEASSEVEPGRVIEMSMGEADAPVEIIEYASFTCPHCASFHEGPFKQLKADYIDTGKARFIYREVYFDKYGMWASLLARCGGEARFFGITDMIYAGQSEWSRAGSDAAIADELRKIGRLAGMNGEEIDACLSDGEKLQTLVAWYQQNAEEHGIRSTPSFVINGQTYQNMSYADFRAIIEDELG